jgi:hypothetical protein
VPKRTYWSIQLVFLLLPIYAISQTYEISAAPFNSGEADFGGVFRNESFIFSSSRQKTAITYNEDTLHQFFTDLYQTRQSSDGTWQTPSPLNGRVNTIMNEAQCTISADGKMMYYTGNLKNALSQKKEKAEKYELGIFHATQYNREWIDDGSFVWNSAKSMYSCGHPCLAQNDSLLYFSSNQPGGFGGSDIYVCAWENNQWSQPQNLGAEINTKGNEFFPFVNEYGILYFTSDGRSDSQGMDIYSAEWDKDKFQDVLRLDEPINSNADDFAYTERIGSNRGAFSSNREKDNDDIYLFTKYEDNYLHCLTNSPPGFCYLISDENYPRLDTLPFVYEWHISDGSRFNGSKIKHCFPDFGTYEISLNIRDTLTKHLVMTASKNEIVIEKPTDPYMEVEESCSLSQPLHAKLHLPTIHEMDTTQILWLFDEKEIGKGQSIDYQPTQPGAYTLTCRLKTKVSKRSSAKKICVEQNITVHKDSIEIEIPKYAEMTLNIPDPFPDQKGGQLLPKYYLTVVQNKSKLEQTAAPFAHLKDTIYEMQNEQDYIYILSEHNDLNSALLALENEQNLGLQLTITKCTSTRDIYSHKRTFVPREPKAQDKPAEEIILDSDYNRQVKYTAAVMQLEPTMQVTIHCQYGPQSSASNAEAKALKIKELLTSFNVQPQMVDMVTEYKEEIDQLHHIKLILTYPHKNDNNE